MMAPRQTGPSSCPPAQSPTQRRRTLTSMTPALPRTHYRRPWSAGLFAALLAGAALTLCPQSAEAQPNRRDKPLRTPKAATTPKAGVAKPGGKAATPKAGAKPVGPGGAKPGGAAGDNQPGGPGNKIGAAPQIDYKPVPAHKRVSFNMDDVDLPDLVKAISKMTGRRFIFGGKVRQIKATIEAPTKVTVAEAYQAFLSVLETNGMTVIPHGRYLKIVETGGIASQTTPVLGTAEPVPYSDRFVTRLYRLKHVDASVVSTVLGKFKSRDADLTVYEPSNLLIITDTGSNIRRLLRITEELDAGAAGDQIWIQPVHNVAASDLVSQLNEVLEGSRARLIADDRNNSLIMVASDEDYQRLLELVKRVDVPMDKGEGGIHVLPLQHAQCADLQQTLSGILGGRATASRATGRNPRTSGRDAGRRTNGATGTGGEAEVFEGTVNVNCDEATNALVTTSSLRDYAQLRNVIDKLDQPRRQVFIEAVIMDVNVDHSNDWGIGYHGGATSDLGGGGDTIFYGGNNPQQSMLGVPANLEALAFGVRGPDLDGTSQLLGTGVSIPGFGIVLHALARSGDSNVLATPHLRATDNILAEISIGQNIPLQTNVGGGLGSLAGLGGCYGQAGALGGLGGLLGGSMGFQAPRQDVGIRLKITPHINDSDQVRMELSEEFSDAGSPTGALGAVPINKRTADTTVIVRDQQTVVIGGLVREGQVNGMTKVPVLGDIPVLGFLFRQQTKQTQKTNLLLVLTPHIIRDQNDLRRIFERKMQERQEFLDRYFVFDDSLPWEPLQDYSRAKGLLEHIRQTQLAIQERERLQQELQPDSPKTHDPVKPVPLPSAEKTGTTRAPVKAATKKRTTTKPRTTRARAAKSRVKVPGGLRRSDRYRVE